MLSLLSHTHVLFSFILFPVTLASFLAYIENLRPRNPRNPRKAVVSTPFQSEHPMAIIQLFERSKTDKIQIRASDAVYRTLFVDSTFLLNDSNNKNVNQGETVEGRRHVLKRTEQTTAPSRYVTLHDLANPQEVLDHVSGKARLISTHYDRVSEMNVYVFIFDGQVA